MSLDLELSSVSRYAQLISSVEKQMDRKHRPFFAYLTQAIKRIFENPTPLNEDLKNFLENSVVQSTNGQSKASVPALEVLLGITYDDAESQNLTALIEPYLIANPIDQSLANFKAYRKILDRVPKDQQSLEIKKNILSLFESVDNDYQRDKLFKRLENISSEELINKIDLAKQFLKDISDTYQKVEITLAVFDCTYRINNECIAFCQGLKGSERVALLNATCVAEDCVSLSLSICRTEIYGREIVSMMKTVDIVIQKGRSSLLIELTPYLEHIREAFHKKIIVEVINDIPEEHLKECMGLILPKLRVITNGYQGVSMIRDVATIIKAQSFELLKMNNSGH